MRIVNCTEPGSAICRSDLDSSGYDDRTPLRECLKNQIMVYIPLFVVTCLAIGVFIYAIIESIRGLKKTELDIDMVDLEEESPVY